MVFLTGGGNHLVHDAAVHTDPAVFRALAEQRHLRGIPRKAADALKRSRHCQFVGGGGGQARAHRHVAGRDAFPSLQLAARFLQRPRHAFRIFAPVFRLFFQARAIEFQGRVVIEGMQHDAPVGARAQRDPSRPVDCHRQDKPVVVVGMLADQVDASRGAHHDGGRLSKPGGELSPNGLLWLQTHTEWRGSYG